MRAAALSAGLLVALAGGAGAADRLPGPVPAELVGVVDGDTLRVAAEIWIDQRVTVLVRLRGVDAPELHARCEAERRGAEAARAWLADAAAAPLMLYDIAPDKYAGRVDARVVAGDVDLAAGLLAAGLARPYGGGARAGWC